MTAILAAILSLAEVASVASVVWWARIAMSAVEARAHSEMLRAVARAKHVHRLRVRADGGSGESRVGGVSEGPARQPGVETRPHVPASPPIVAGTDTTPPVPFVPATPASAGTGRVAPRPSCARRIQPAGAPGHPGAPAALSPVDAGRVVPHTLPASTGPHRVRVMIHGC